MNLFILCALIVFLFIVLAILKRWPLTHRQRILSYSTPISWIKDLEENFPAYQRMSPPSQKMFIDRLKIHLAEVPCLALADCPIDTRKRLLALAPWCALSLNIQLQPIQLKRIMILLPQEENQYQPLVEKNELLLVWHEEKMRYSMHSKYLDDNLLLHFLAKIYRESHFQTSPSWEELVYETTSYPIIEQSLGWQTKT
jgi:Mlc titration factor MtfA (ptsG expression regulator)